MDHSAAEYVAATRAALTEAERSLDEDLNVDAASARAAIGQGWALLAVAAAVQETGGDLGDAVDGITPPA